MPDREFIITDGAKYAQRNINGRYQKVNNLSLADTYESYSLAKKVLSNSIPKSWANRFFVGEIVDGEIIQCNAPKCDL